MLLSAKDKGVAAAEHLIVDREPSYSNLRDVRLRVQSHRRAAFATAQRISCQNAP